MFINDKNVLQLVLYNIFVISVEKDCLLFQDVLRFFLSFNNGIRISA